MPADDTLVDQPEILFAMASDHVALVTLNRPEKRNAVSARLAALMAEAVGRVEADPEIRVAVLAAKGRVFCSGADLIEAARGVDILAAGGEGGFAGLVRAKRTKPWIAAVGGPALAGGMELALACDLVLAAESAQFGLPEVRRGLMPAAGGAVRLPRLIPRNIAIEMLITGEPMTAATAVHWGLVNRITADGQVVEEALVLARRIAANAPMAVRETLRIARLSAEGGGDALIAESIASLQALGRTEDLQEGLAAFAEKRDAVWRNR